jgi:hypothetical protein
MIMAKSDANPDDRELAEMLAAETPSDAVAADKAPDTFRAVPETAPAPEPPPAMLAPPPLPLITRVEQHAVAAAAAGNHDVSAAMHSLAMWLGELREHLREAHGHGDYTAHGLIDEARSLVR